MTDTTTGALAGERVAARGSDRRWIVVVAALHALVFGPVAFHALFRPGLVFPNLWLWHAARIPDTFRTPLTPVQPHFGWHLFAKAIDVLLPGTDPRIAGTATSILASAGFGVALYVVFRRTDDGRVLLRPAAAVGAGLALALMESPAALQGFQALASPTTRFVPLYYSFVPTTLAAMGLNVAMVWLTGLLVDGRLGSRARRFLPLLVVATAIAKPNLVPAIALVAPALAWVAARRGEGGPRQRVVDALRLVTLPAAIVTAFQFSILRWFSPAYLTGGIAIRPMWELREFGGLGWQFWLICLFPLVALLLVRSPLLDVSVRVSLGLFLVGLGASVIFARSGQTLYKGADGGDIIQLAGAGATVLLIFACRRVLILRREGRVSAAVLAVLALTLVPYLAAGVMTWRCQGAGVACYEREVAPIWPQPGYDEPGPVPMPRDGS
ncbi:MAG: hypothetical protein U0Q22_02680 [Acidimicrobiales bacterium]